MISWNYYFIGYVNQLSLKRAFVTPVFTNDKCTKFYIQHTSDEIIIDKFNPLPDYYKNALFLFDFPNRLVFGEGSNCIYGFTNNTRIKFGEASFIATYILENVFPVVEKDSLSKSVLDFIALHKPEKFRDFMDRKFKGKESISNDMVYDCNSNKTEGEGTVGQKYIKSYEELFNEEFAKNHRHFLTISNHGIAEVRRKISNEQNAVFALRVYQPGDVIADFSAGTICAEPTYLTVQIGEGKHITLQPEFLLYINHSCGPNVFFDTKEMQLIALRTISLDEEMTFFYPATEWEMTQSFDCYCGSPKCLGRIQGAKFLSYSLINQYRFNDFIQKKLKETEDSHYKSMSA